MEKTAPSVSFITPRSVDNLQTLYTVVIALALVESIKAILNFGADTATIGIDTKSLPTFAALTFTIIPFHHGASRYLDETYIRKSPGRPLSGLIDFFLFFIEAIAFYVMALLISQPKSFFFVLSGLFGIDILWLIFVYFTQPESFKKIKWWLFLNAGMVLALLVVNAGKFMADGTCKWTVLAVLVLIRTVIDYKSEWAYYWPTNGVA